VATVTATCTPGGASDNSYITRADADTWFGKRLDGEQWLKHSADRRERALVQATAMIESLGGKVSATCAARALFPGSPYDTGCTADEHGDYVRNQALHFPTGDDQDENSDVFVPEWVWQAVCFQAVYLLNGDKPLVDVAALTAQGVRSFQADGISMQLTGASIPAGISPDAWALVGPQIKPSPNAPWGATRMRV